MQSSENNPNVGDATVGGAALAATSNPNGVAHTPHHYGRTLKSHVANDWRNQRTPTGAPPRFQAPPYHGSRGKGPGWNRWVQQTTENRYEESDISYSREAWKATEEGRRLYFGNLDWNVKAADIAIWLEGAGYNTKVVDMPAQIETGPKRPLFCFVEFDTVEETEAVRTTLSGRRMRGRPVKIDFSKGKHTPARTISTGHAEEPQTPSKPKIEAEPVSTPAIEIAEPTPPVEIKKAPTGSFPESNRLFVGGFPQVENINELEDMIRELFIGFNVESLSDVMGPRKSKFAQTDNNATASNYCFVDLPNIAEAKMAVRFLNKRETSWGAARVSFAAGGAEGKLKYRSYENSQPKQQEQQTEEEDVGQEAI
ncbi:hypothetical protein TWF696_005697 [Orbilia brochopaga]|uniref:RRM domain-containing protein n=1 Tax=Orbilia brochopaga TaxID=3140254 RepID=A0AAV9UVA8_9PEZI